MFQGKVVLGRVSGKEGFREGFEASSWEVPEVEEQVTGMRRCHKELHKKWYFPHTALTLMERDTTSAFFGTECRAKGWDLKLVSFGQALL